MSNNRPAIRRRRDYAWDQDAHLILDDPELCLWGRGYRMDELRAAVLRVQLRKLPATIQHMRDSKYRIRKALARYEEVSLRRVLDAAGDTGCFPITTYPDAVLAQAVNSAMRAEGIVTFEQSMSNVLMTDWGPHLYYNNLSLAARRGFPWDLPANVESPRDYSGSVVLQLLNPRDAPAKVTVAWRDQVLKAELPALSIGTYQWSAN